MSDTPGTTRDTIEETMVVDGIAFRFIDTAGLRQSSDEIEKLGLERSRKAIEKANVIIFLRDARTPSDSDIEELLPDVDGNEKIMFVVNNKCDLVQPPYPSGISISALKGIGVDDLKRSMVAAVKQRVDEQGDVLLTNARHYEAMKKVLAALGEVRKGMDVDITPDLLVIDIRDALYHLGTITGKITNDEILSTIFSRFCIGK